MRILANYGYKNNGDTYSVTFETMGDVAKENADSVVDELFALAKTAIQRQINPSAVHSTPHKQKDETVVIPEPGLGEQNHKVKNGGAKPQLKDPDAPATKKQKSFIVRLAKEKGQFIDNLNELTMQEASEKIEELMTV